ncbi:MAG: ribonuclease III [Candidatus Paceibacterota bacterium]|jgi:ribonuclease-3
MTKNNIKDFSPLEKSLNISFKNKDLLVQAFCHRSYLNENPNFYLGHNERLEFLGDAVLELITTEYLFKSYPDKPEGEMTGWRASLVNANILSDTAKELGFEDFLLLSSGEEKEKGKARKYILSDTFEAFIGSLYLDSGYEISKKFIEKNLIERMLPEIIEKKLFKDPKSLFQEKAQEIIGITPIYQVLEEEGPDHLKSFVVGVLLGEEVIAKGEGSSKHEAELKAAEEALRVKNW